MFCVFVFVWFWPPACALLQLEAQEEKLRLEEEARNAAQREAARLARERKVKEVRRQAERSLPPVCSDFPEINNFSSDLPPVHAGHPSPQLITFVSGLSFCQFMFL